MSMKGGEGRGVVVDVDVDAILETRIAVCILVSEG